MSLDNRWKCLVSQSNTECHREHPDSIQKGPSQPLDLNHSICSETTVLTTLPQSPQHKYERLYSINKQMHFSKRLEFLFFSRFYCTFILIQTSLIRLLDYHLLCLILAWIKHICQLLIYFWHPNRQMEKWVYSLTLTKWAAENCILYRSLWWQRWQKC